MRMRRIGSYRKPTCTHRQARARLVSGTGGLVVPRYHKYVDKLGGRAVSCS